MNYLEVWMIRFKKIKNDVKNFFTSFFNEGKENKFS